MPSAPFKPLATAFKLALMVSTASVLSWHGLLASDRVSASNRPRSFSKLKTCAHVWSCESRLTGVQQHLKQRECSAAATTSVNDDGGYHSPVGPIDRDL